MISKEAFQLVQRLNELKNSEGGKQSKKLKVFLHSIGDYQAKSKKCIVDLNEKISSVEDELKIIRDYQKSEEQVAIKKVDEFELSLKRLIESYQSEASQANRKLESMVETIKQEFKTSFRQNIKIERNAIDRFKSVSNRLSVLIQAVRRQQKNSIDNYEHLRSVVRQKSNQLANIQQNHVLEITRNSQRILIQITELENKVRTQLDRFLLKKQKKNYETNKLIHRMIQQVTNN